MIEKHDPEFIKISEGTSDSDEKTNPSKPSEENTDTPPSDDYLPKGDLSIYGAIANLVNSIIGSTVLSLPESNRESGVIGTLLINIVLFLGTAYCLHTILQAANTFRVLSLNRLFYVISGNIGMAINVFMVVFMASCACIAYYMIMTDSMIGIIQYIGINYADYDKKTAFACNPFQNTYIIKLIFMILIIGMLLPPKITKLTIISFISVTSVLILFISITVIAIKDLSNPKLREIGLHTVKMFNTDTPSEILNTISVYSQAYICQFNVLPIRNEMKQRTKRNYQYLASIPPFVSFLVYEFFGLIGYLQYGQSILGNITLHYSQSFFEYLSRASALLVVFLTFPVIFFAARKIFHNFFFSPNQSMSITTKEGLYIFIPLYLSVSIVSLFVKTLSKILTLTGSLFGPFITFNLPAIVKIFSNLKKEQLSKNGVNLNNHSQLVASLNSTSVPPFRLKATLTPYYLLFIFGTLITIVGMISSIKKFISPYQPFDIAVLPLQCGVSSRYKQSIIALKKLYTECNKNSNTAYTSTCTVKNAAQLCKTAVVNLSNTLHEGYFYEASIPDDLHPSGLNAEQKKLLIKAFYRFNNNYLSTMANLGEHQCVVYDQLIKVNRSLTSPNNKDLFSKLNQNLSKNACKDANDFDLLRVSEYRNENTKAKTCLYVDG